MNNEEIKNEVLEWWSCEKLWGTGANIMYAFGQRKDGKTTDGLRKGLKLYFEKGHKFIYLRRMDTDLTVKNGIDMLFNYFTVESDELLEMSGGKYNSIKFRAGAFYLGYVDEELKATWEKDDFCHCCAINMSNHYRGNPWTNYHYVLFDEFIPETDEGYIVNEFTKFINCISSFKRNKKEFKVLCVGNTINPYNIYFTNLGLLHAKNQEQGTIEVYTSEDTDEKISVEYCAHMKDKENEKFFSVFKSEAMDMILHGGWQAPYAPPKPIDFDERDIVFIYFIKFDNDYYQCEIVEKDDVSFTFIHKKTGEIYEEDEDLVFTQDYDVRENWRRNIKKPFDNIGRIILSYFEKDKVFYQDNLVGQMMKNYMKWCENE